MRENLSRIQKQLATEYKGIQDDYTECLVKFKVGRSEMSRAGCALVRICGHRLGRWPVPISKSTEKLLISKSLCKPRFRLCPHVADRVYLSSFSAIMQYVLCRHRESDVI
jgi:hypothetical protein